MRPSSDWLKPAKTTVFIGNKYKQIKLSCLYHETSRFLKKIMVSAEVSWEGKPNIIF